MGIVITHLFQVHPAYSSFLSSEGENFALLEGKINQDLKFLLFCISWILESLRNTTRLLTTSQRSLERSAVTLSVRIGANLNIVLVSRLLWLVMSRRIV